MPGTGTAVLAFGATPADQASVAVTGQAGILTTSHVEAWFMADAVDTLAHEEAAVHCSLICGSLIAGTGFTIRGIPREARGIGSFTVHWAWL